MAGCWRKEDKRRYDTEAALIAAGIKSGALAVRTVEEKRTMPGRTFDTGERFNFAGMPARGAVTMPDTVKTTRRQFIDRRACVAWLDAIGEKNPSEYVLAWLGEEWNEEAAKIGAGDVAPPKKASAGSRPGERQSYFRTLWEEFDKPSRNEKIWKAMQQRKGANGCPVVSVTANVDFTFRYSDDNTDRLDKAIFQKDMSAVRKG